MRRVAAHLPDAMVGLAPAPFQIVEQGQLQPPGIVADVQPVLVGDVQDIHDLAAGVDLELRIGAIADAHGPRTAMPRQPRQFVLLQIVAAIDAVHDVHRPWFATDRAHEPVAPLARLLAIAIGEQRVQREGGVAQPAVAVVPVAHAAWHLRQRSRRRGDHPAGRVVDRSFQDHQRPNHLFAPPAAVRAAARPVVPPRHAVVVRLHRIHGVDQEASRPGRTSSRTWRVVRPGSRTRPRSRRHRPRTAPTRRRQWRCTEIQHCREIHRRRPPAGSIPGPCGSHAAIAIRSRTAVQSACACARSRKGLPRRGSLRRSRDSPACSPTPARGHRRPPSPIAPPANPRDISAAAGSEARRSAAPSGRAPAFPAATQSTRESRSVAGRASRCSRTGRTVRRRGSF